MTAAITTDNPNAKEEFTVGFWQTVVAVVNGVRR
jgi:hypothetical protein